VNTDFPTSDMELTHILVVSNMEQSRHFYGDVFGATVVREYSGTSCVLKFQGSWLLLVIGGEPTRDKPTVTFAPPPTTDTVSHAMTIRVLDCQGMANSIRGGGLCKGNRWLVTGRFASNY